jgi:YD repeat-containing protein
MAKNATCSVYFLASFIWLLPLLGYAQATNGPQLPNILPPSPTIAALGKYVEVPVSLYTGVPTISIPLYEIKSRDIAVPISLSYHAGGNRVGEEASWVGLGWSLNAGGVVGHTIRGRDDLLPSLNQNSTNPMPDFEYPSRYPGYTAGCSGFTAGGQPVDYCYEPPSPEADWEPDAFFYNFLSQSGKFVLDQQRTPQLLQQAKVKIDLPPAAGGGGFTIRTADGFRYEFFAAEFTNYISSGGQSNGHSWYLTKIVSPTGEEVTFTYERAATAVFQVSSLSQTVIMDAAGGAEGSCEQPPVSGSYTTPIVNELYLSRIDFRTGHVTFERGAQLREDLRNGQRLQFVKIYETGLSTPVKEFELVSSYFVSPLEQQGSLNYSYSAEEHAYAGKRLRLDQLIERGGGQAKPPHRFVYNSTPLPYKTSYSRDHWDFFNGANNSKLAASYVGVSPVSNQFIKFAGADREPNPAKVTASLLEQIQYPTGGKSRFTYEANEYGNVRADDAQPWVARTVTAYQRSFPNGTFDTQAPGPFTIAPMPGVVGGNTTLNVSIRLEINGCYQNCRDDYTFVQLRQLDGSYSSTWSLTSSAGASATTVNVPYGQYRLTASTRTGSAVQLAFIAIDIMEKSFVPVYKKVGGGVRIASITEEDGASVNPSLTRRFNYNKTVQDNLGTHLSSHGILMSRPRYHRYMVLPLSDSPCQTFESSSSSNIQLSNTAQGALVGYSSVEELRGPQGGGGKTVYQYANQEDYVYEYQERIGSVPTLPDPLNGYLSGRTDYRNDNGVFSKIRQVTDSYEAIREVRIRGVVREPVAKVVRGSLGGAVFNCRGCKLPLHRYYIHSYLIRKTYSSDRRYDTVDDTRFSQTSTDYFYDTGNNGHLQVSRTETRRSDGSTAVTSLTYPADYTAVAAGPLAEMRSDAKYQHSAVVETLTSVYGPNETFAQAKTTGGTYTEYAQPAPTSGFLPITERALELPQPTANLVASAPALPPAGRYVPKAQLGYDPVTANLQQIQKTQDTPTAYLWGYRNALPVAMVQNATFSQVQAALSALGTSASDLSQETSTSRLQTTFAQLRQRLPQARITGFTHAPLVGLTSQTTPDGRTITYEYDGLGRLVRTRDEHNRILSQQRYHYARP